MGLEVQLTFRPLDTVQEVEVHILFAITTGLILTANLYLIIKMCRKKRNSVYTSITP